MSHSTHHFDTECASHPDCPLCRRIVEHRDAASPFVIHEFEHSLFVVGEHQFHEGYAQLWFKRHVREIHELDISLQTALFGELMAATQALVKTFEPWKMNHACYGNQVQHIHWHLFPRYDSRPDHLQHPWLHADEFKNHAIEAAQAATLARSIRCNL